MRFFFEELLIGFEFKNFLIALAVLFIFYLAWESTYVRDYRVQPNAVLIIEDNRRLLVDIGAIRQRDLRPGTDWTLETVHQENTNRSASDQRTNVAEGEGLTAENTSNSNNSNSGSRVQIPEPPPSLEVVIEEVHDLASVRQRLAENAYRTLESFGEGMSNLFDDTDIGPQRVIQAMDTTEGIRRRRLAFYNHETAANLTNEPSTAENADPIDESGGAGESADLRINAENCSNENTENENRSKADVNKEKAGSQPDGEDQKDQIRIKLKYLNDDMKLVKGSPRENIGDFKRRNFTLELDAQKFVRLVFNGHVLQPDSKTLEACGLFDNCVVHCLVHNRNPHAANQNQQSGQSSLSSGNTSNQSSSTAHVHPSNTDGTRTDNFSNHESSFSVMIATYAAIGFFTLALILCWYCRIQYYFFFSWYSTFVLILVTILLSILAPLLVFIVNNEIQPPA